MAHALFDPGREGILDRTIDITAGTVKAALLRGYVFNAAHKFLSDIVTAGGTVVGTPQALASKTYTNGVLAAANVTFPLVPTGSPADTLFIYNDTGTNSTSRMISCDTTATGLPVTPNGTDIGVTWDTGSNKIFKI